MYTKTKVEPWSNQKTWNGFRIYHDTIFNMYELIRGGNHIVYKDCQDKLKAIAAETIDRENKGW